MLMLCAPFCPATAQDAVNWSKYVTPDQSFSFYYPAGWSVQENASGFVIHDAESYEQLWLVILPYQDDWTAQDHADFFLTLIQEENPEMYSFDWETQGEEAVVFGLAHGNGQNRAEGVGLVLKDADFEQALWFHYLAPGDLFSEDRGFLILEGFVNSLASGASALPPAGSAEAWVARVDRNADGFLFILEFALGAPLSLAEETLILTELKSVLMEYSDADLAGYDDYPGFAQFIMSLAEQDELMEVKTSLHESVWEWVEESDPDDPIVSLIREALLEGDRILVPGTTELTEVAATAYAEFVALAELLAWDSDANPGDIKNDTVSEIKGQLADAWSGFSQDEKEQVLTLPAVWTTLRHALSHGEAEDRDYALSIIAKAAPQASEASADESDESYGEYDPMALARHHAMLQINQMTFNHWQYCMGYKSTIWGW